MKVAASILLVLSVAVSSREGTEGGVATDLTAELTAIEHALVRAWVERDEKAIEGILADDWTVIDFAGRVLTKAEVMREGFRSQDRQIEAGSIDEIQVRALG